MTLVPRGRSLVAWFFVALAIATGALWVRGRQRVEPPSTVGAMAPTSTTPIPPVGDAVVLFTGSKGRAQIAAATRGRIFLVFSNVPCGVDRAWTVLTATGDFDKLDELIDVNRINYYPEPSAAAPVASEVPGYFGFALVTAQRGGLVDFPSSRFICLMIPDWFLILAFLGCAASVHFGRAAQRQRRAARGLCAECGYDLRASNDRCPECGAAISKTSREPVKSA